MLIIYSNKEKINNEKELFKVINKIMRDEKLSEIIKLVEIHIPIDFEYGNVVYYDDIKKECFSIYTGNNRFFALGKPETILNDRNFIAISNIPRSNENNKIINKDLVIIINEYLKVSLYYKKNIYYDFNINDVINILKMDNNCFTNFIDKNSKDFDSTIPEVIYLEQYPKVLNINIEKSTNNISFLDDNYELPHAYITIETSIDNKKDMDDFINILPDKCFIEEYFSFDISHNIKYTYGTEKYCIVEHSNPSEYKLMIRRY